MGLYYRKNEITVLKKIREKPFIKRVLSIISIKFLCKYYVYRFGDSFMYGQTVFLYPLAVPR